MANHLNVVVYLRAKDVQLLREKELDPARWVRAAVKEALAQERGKAPEANVKWKQGVVSSSLPEQ